MDLELVYLLKQIATLLNNNMNNINKKAWFVLVPVGLLILIATGFLFYFRGIPFKYWFKDATSFAECTEASGRVLESYPEQCIFRKNSFTNPDQKINITPEPAQSSYDFSDYNISFQTPAGWLVKEYTSRTQYDLTGKSVVSMALDPKVLSTQEEFETLDKPAGMIVMLIGDVSAFDLSGLVNQTAPQKLNSEVEGYKNRQAFGKETDNPWWQGKVRTDYFINIPLANQKNTYKSLTVYISNTIAQDKDQALQAIIKNFIYSISFKKDLSGTDSRTKTYTNTKFGYSVNYPANSVKATDYQPDNERLSVATKSSCAATDYTKYYGENFRDCQIINIWVDPLVGATFGERGQKVTIAGRSGEKFLYNIDIQDGQGGNIPVWSWNGQVEKNGYWYKFDLKFHSSQLSEATTLFDEILNSFKFISPGPKPISN